MRIEICAGLAIDSSELEENFIQAGGPGGQNVNKLASAAQLRFDARHSPNLPDDVRRRAERLAGRRINSEGVIVITARRYRSQERNRQDALERLIELLKSAAQPPVRRRATRPSQAERRRRREEKAHRSATKVARRRVNPAD